MSDTKKKVGRPKSLNSNVVKLTVRVSEKQNRKLDEYCEKHNISKADAMRKAFKLLTD